MNNSESKIPEIIFNNVANLTGYWRIFGLNVLIMKSDMRLTTLGISLNPVNRSLNSAEEGPHQYVKIFNSSIGTLKTTAGISILVKNCFTIGLTSTYIELENSTLNISNFVFHNVVNNRAKYPSLVFAWGNSKVTIQDTIIQPFEVLAVIINHSELHMKNVSFKGHLTTKDGRCKLISDNTVLISYNLSVINIDNCSFTDFCLEHHTIFNRSKWTFATLNGNSFSNRFHTKEAYFRITSMGKIVTACTFNGAGAAITYFENTVVLMCNTSFNHNVGTRFSVWVAKHSKLFTHNLRFSYHDQIGIFGTDSQIETDTYSVFDNYYAIIAVQDSNVKIKDYNTSSPISLINSFATIENTMTINGPSGAIFAQGSTIHIENSTFSSEFSVNSDTDVFLTNSTLSGTYLQLGGLLITNHSCINITNSEIKVLNNYNSFSVFVKHDSSAHFTSTMFLSGQQEQFDDLIQYDSEFLSYNFPSVFSTCNSSSVVLDYYNFINTTEFRIYLFSNITFLNTTFENNAGIYEVADDSYLQFDGCSLLRGSEKVFANKGAVVSIKKSNIAYGRSKITLLNKSLLSLLRQISMTTH